MITAAEQTRPDVAGVFKTLREALGYLTSSTAWSHERWLRAVGCEGELSAQRGIEMTDAELDTLAAKLWRIAGVTQTLFDVVARDSASVEQLLCEQDGRVAELLGRGATDDALALGLDLALRRRRELEVGFERSPTRSR